MDAKKPKAHFNAGLISCAVWENEIDVEGQRRTILKATVARRYLDKTGAWKSTQSFTLTDIPLVVYVLQKAFEAMVTESGSGEEESETSPTEREPS
jgi:hypothetical protein